MAYRGVSPGCVRKAIDFPQEMADKIQAAADAPPKIPYSEWCRRVLAHAIGYEMPPLTERKAKRLRLTGEAKKQGGKRNG